MNHLIHGGHPIRSILVVGLTVLVAQLGIMYGIAAWFRASESSKPLVLGVSFVPAYAESLGLEAPATMQALIDDVGVRHFRLVSHWNRMEPAPGQYDFTELDWQFAKAEEAGAKVTLSVGLRQPRWPECHMPDWAAKQPADVWQPRLEAFMAGVVERYRSSPALNSYQLENEYFLKAFGTCTNFDRTRLVSEYELVTRLDPNHPLIMTRADNFHGWPVREPTPDVFATSIYRKVWNTNFYTGYFTYPVPAWYYAFIAGWQKLVTGRSMIVHELQTEAWPPNRQTITETSLKEQNKSFSAPMLGQQVEFAKDTGMREIYLWGGEYWYYRMVKLNDPSVWQTAKDTYRQR